MANLVSWLLEEAAGEPIEAVVIGDPPRYFDEELDDRQKRHQLLTWEEAKPMLDYHFIDGLGQVGCNAVWAWTATKVLFVSQYDGSTGLCWVPRNPIAGSPDMPGG